MDTIVVNRKEYELIYVCSSSLRKYWSIRVNSYGKIEVLYSRFMRIDYQKEIESFIRSQSNYIQQRLAKLRILNLPTFENDSNLFLLGKKYRLYRSKRINKIIKERDGIVIPRKYEIKNLEDYFESILEDTVLNRLNFYTEKYGFHYNEVNIITSPRCWGRCINNERYDYVRLEFNIALVFLPLEYLDYVIVHELCHLKQANHSKLFWNEVESIMPDAKKRRKILHSSELKWHLERLGIYE